MERLVGLLYPIREVVSLSLAFYIYVVLSSSTQVEEGLRGVGV